MSIAFTNPFDPYYDLYSIDESELIVPDYFNRFVPDNQVDYNCIMVLTPNLDKGVKKWTLGDRWITIGVYRDEGRAPAQRQNRINLQWSRTGDIVIITDLDGHKLKVGDSINVYNVNMSVLTDAKVIKVIDQWSFSFKSSVVGAISGSNGAYQPNFITNFYETHRVFRLLPSFKLVPWADIQSLFVEIAPAQQAKRRSIYNITTSKVVKIPNAKSQSVNFELSNQTQPKIELLSLERRYGQVYNETGITLQLEYLPSGDFVPTNNVDSATKNPQIFLTTLKTGDQGTRIHAFDFYGLDVNDATRSPYNSDQNVTRDTTITGNLNNLKLNVPVTGSLNDEFGNLAIGVQSNNALVVRKQVLPLVLDSFNKPIKAPL